jgi:hypothetical protein
VLAEKASDTILQLAYLEQALDYAMSAHKYEQARVFAS